MKIYKVTLPIAGHVELPVAAESETEAIDMAMQKATLLDASDWKILYQFARGNVNYCPLPWKAQARITFDDEKGE